MMTKSEAYWSSMMTQKSLNAGRTETAHVASCFCKDMSNGFLSASVSLGHCTRERRIVSPLVFIVSSS